MLINDFFYIKNIQAGDKYIIDVELNAAHPIFKGHFPGLPVTPGVCLIQMIQETLAYITQKNLTMATGDNIKFTAVLNPEITPRAVITLHFKTKDNGFLQADSTIAYGEINFFSFKGSFKMG